MTTQLNNNLLVGVGIGTYTHLDPLEHAVDDVKRIAARLRDDGFKTVTSLDGNRAEIAERLIEALPSDSLQREGTVLIVLWAGHASQNQATHAFRLLSRENTVDEPEINTFTAEQLAEVAAKSGAAQLLILIDTCHSGSAVVDVAQVVDSVRKTFAHQRHRWMGIVASCQDYERAVDGALATKLLELLEHGPKQAELRIRWSSYQAGLRGDDLIDALVKEWGEEERQSLKQLSGGDPWLVLPNPLFNPSAPDQVVEHLLWAARGASPDEGGFWFVGRERQLREIVGRMRREEPGACAITGSAGSGKSAIAGRLVSLSSREERAKVIAAEGAPNADLDPGEEAIDAHVQVRGMTLERCAEVLGKSLGVVGTSPVPNHHDVLAWAASAQSPPIVVVDGLDEAGAEAFRISSELLRPLAQYALVIVASRELPGVEQGASLLESLGTTDLLVNLDDHPEETERDIRDYVLRRLSSRSNGDGTE